MFFRKPKFDVKYFFDHFAPATIHILLFIYKSVLLFFLHSYLHSYFNAAFVNVCKMLISDAFTGKKITLNHSCSHWFKLLFYIMWTNLHEKKCEMKQTSGRLCTKEVQFVLANGRLFLWILITHRPLGTANSLLKKKLTLESKKLILLLMIQKIGKNSFLTFSKENIQKTMLIFNRLNIIL